MQTGALIIDFKNLIGPAGRGSEVSNPGILVWLNDAYMKAVGEINEVNPDFFTKQVSTAVIEGQGEYELPPDFEKMVMISLSYDDSTYVRALPLNNVGQALDIQQSTSVNFTTSQPYYYITSTHFGILPVPDATHDNTLKIWYTYSPPLLAEDFDEPAIPYRMQSVLKYDMYANYLDQNDEHVAAEKMRQRFGASIAQLVDQLAVRQVDQPRTVEVTNDNGIYFSDF